MRMNITGIRSVVNLSCPVGFWIILKIQRLVSWNSMMIRGEPDGSDPGRTADYLENSHISKKDIVDMQKCHLPW